MNAKELFNVKSNSITDLHPDYVNASLQYLFNEISAIPGIYVRNDPIFLEARENSTWLF